MSRFYIAGGDLYYRGDGMTYQLPWEVWAGAILLLIVYLYFRFRKSN